MVVEIFAIGILISSLFIELTGIYPGGIIVPAYFSVHLDQPLRIIGTIAASVIIWIVYRALALWLILFGHRRFALLLALSALLGMFSHHVLPTIWPAALELRIIGWVVSGVLANSFERQGVWRSLCGVAIVSVVIYFIVHLI